MSETVRTPSAVATPEQIARATSVVAIGASLVAWWPAFTLGAYGVVFFQPALSLWAAATAVFLVSLGSARRDRISWPQRLSLLIPSGWLIAAFLSPTGGPKDARSQSLFWAAVVISLLGVPYLAGLLLRVWMAGYEQLSPRRRLAVVGVVAVVVVSAFLLGHFNNLFLTCEDFTISGNDTPADCTEGPGTLSR